MALPGQVGQDMAQHNSRCCNRCGCRCPGRTACEGTDDADMPCVDDCYLRVAGQTVPANCERPTPGQLIRASRARKKTHPGGKDLAVLPSLVRVLFPDSHGAAQCLARPSGSSCGMPGHHRECAMKHAESSAPSAIQEVTKNNDGMKRCCHSVRAERVRRTAVRTAVGTGC